MKRHRRKTHDPAYENMRLDLSIPQRCWRCGRTERDVPSWWHAPWTVERAHIVNKPRAEDRRAVVLLCSFCHRSQHGERFHVAAYREPLPLRILLAMKKFIDPMYFDRGWLACHHVGRLPSAAPVTALRPYWCWTVVQFKERPYAVR